MAEVSCEYKFPHEENPVLTDEAADAVNRTLWVQHWERVRKAVKIEVFLATLYGLFGAGLGLIKWLKPVWASSTPISASPYLLLLLGSIGLAVLFTLVRYGPKLPIAPVRTVMRRPKYVEYGSFTLFLLGLLLGFVFDKKGPSIGLAFVPSFVYMACCDLYEMRKLRKNMINWGLIERNGKALSQSSPIAAQLNEAEATIDSALGKPKRRLFRKAVVAAK